VPLFQSFKNGQVGNKEPVHLLQHLQHFFSSLLGSKEFWAAILAALVGGLFAVYAQQQATKAQRESDLEAEREAADATLRVIATAPGGV
jgi:hypothetical protein